MSPLLRGLVLRRLGRHKLRSALATAAVALGVAAFLATLIVGRTISHTASAVSDATAGGVDLSILPNALDVPLDALAVVEHLDGVAGAAPLTTAWLRVRDVPGRRALVLGIDPLRESRLRRRGLENVGKNVTERVSDPFALLAGTGALVTDALKDALPDALPDAPPDSLPGKALAFLGADGWQTMSVAGTLRSDGVALPGGGRAVLMTATALGRVVGRPGVCQRIDLILQPDADLPVVVKRVEDALSAAGLANLRVGPPRSDDAAAADLLGTVEVGLTIGAVVSLLVGVFLIYHTLAIGVAERRREIGILRALGATRAQVRRVFATEALVLGGVGAVGGVLLAAALAQGAVTTFARTISSAYFAAEAPTAAMTWELALVGVGCGLLVSFVAAVVPASRAAAEEPADAVRRGPEALRVTTPAARRLRLATFVLAFGGAAVFVLFPQPFGRLAGYGALLLSLIGLLTTTPTLLAVGGRVLAPLLTRIAGVPGRLAADDLRRHPLRSALPAAALAFGLALVVETHGVIESMSAETVEWLENDIAGNLFVSSGAKVMGMGNHAPFPAEVGSRLRAVPGVQTAVGIRFALLPFRETRTMILGVDLEPFGRMNRVKVRGIDRATALEGMLQNGDALVSENFARIHGLEIGDAVEFPGLRGTFEVRICGLFRDYSWPRGTVLLDRRLLERHLDDRLVDEFSLVLDDDADEATVIEGIEAATGSDLDLVVTSADDLRTAARKMLGDFFSISYAQVAVAMVVAFLGVLNALWIAVLLRRRELALLRAVGATRRQVVTSVFVQAITLGFLGGLLGVAGGLVVQWVVIQRVMPAETGWVYAVRVPLVTLGATFLLSIVASAIAGILPARLAAQTPLQEALGDE